MKKKKKKLNSFRRLSVDVRVQQLTPIKFQSKVMTFMFVQYFSKGIRLVFL